MYTREDSDYAKYEEQEKEFKKRDAKMKYGRNFEDKESFLRPGEVKRWNKRLKKYVSNKD